MKLLPISAALLFAVAGCSKADASGSAATAAADPRITPAVRDMFKTRCGPCHGESGHGDGPAAAALTPKPRNYTDGAWQKSVKDEDIKKTVLYGGAAVGKSAAMPANPDLDGKPELDGLVALVRGFAPK